MALFAHRKQLVVAALVAAALAAAGFAAVRGKAAPKPAAVAAAPAVEFLQDDLYIVEPQSLQATLPLTGTLSPLVEATLKAGQKHIYGKRTFYLDEDSWNVLEEDSYDTRGNLWRVAIHGLRQNYDALVRRLIKGMWHWCT